ncbi:MAG TPA: hypothetical protein VF721_10070 [Pyrinomonadaceae bacterium]
MCSLTLNNTSNEQLDSLLGERKQVEKKIVSRAFGANTTTAGLLDALSTHLRQMPEDLRHIRKETIGRHRIYYIGHHTDCSYTVFYIKLFKKGDSAAQDDNNPLFQNKLRAGLESPNVRTIEDPNNPPTEETT